MGWRRDTLETALAIAGFALAIRLAEDLPLEAQWQTALSSNAIVFFVAGGDGTLRDGAARLSGTGRILAPLPGGTMNRYACGLGLPADPLDAIAAHRHSIVMDVALAEVNGHPFLYQCIVGRVTWLMRLRERARSNGWRGWFSLLRGLLREALRPQLPRVLAARLSSGRRTHAHTAIVTAPFPGCPSLLRLHIAPHQAVNVLIRQAWLWFRGRLDEDPDILSRRAPSFAIAAPRGAVRLSIDGETCHTTAPLRFRVVPGRLRLLMPRPRSAP